MAIQTYADFLKEVEQVVEDHGHCNVELYDRDGLLLGTGEGMDIPETTKVIEAVCWEMGLQLYGKLWAMLDWTPPPGAVQTRCQRFMGVIFKPDGIHELDPCRYIETEHYENVTVSICRCKRCGHQMLEWRRQPNTIVIREEQDE